MARRPLSRLAASVALTLATLAAALPAAALAQQDASPPTPPCALTGSPNVMAEGRGMLTIGDVAGCPDVRYEIIPGVMINGQAAVRLLPKDDCAPSGAASVMTGDGAAGVRGAAC